MAHIVSFVVTGLVGREKPLVCELNRDVNIFFGSNGSGKTSLLKILHSAMTGDPRPVTQTVFEKAEVTIFSMDKKRTFTRTLDNTTNSSLQEQLRLSRVSATDEIPAYLLDDAYSTVRANLLRQERSWVTKPKGKTTFRWSHQYLPTSRLYLDPGLGKPRSHQFAAEEQYIEDHIETQFARQIESLWSRYSAKMFRAVGEAQADGLASIFRTVLSEKARKQGGVDLDSEVAFQRVATFLRRQGSRDLLGTQESFTKRYKNSSQLRRVVADIDRVETNIELAMAQQNELQQLITTMFSGRKKVVVGATAIELFSELTSPISLASLSTGEKHLLRILIETMLADANSIIIDEPELSMHVDWQHRLVRSMRQLSPEAQLILATHSPEIMADVPDDKIFRI